MKLLKISILSAVFVLTGCETLPDRDPEFAPVRPEALRPPIQKTGSIYQNNYDMRLFESQIARRVGDILMVTLAENTKAKKSADINVNKEPLAKPIKPKNILSKMS